MDKRLLLAVSLSIAVYALWFGFVEKRIMPAPPPSPTTAGTTAVVSPKAQPSSTPPGVEGPAAHQQLLKDTDAVAFGKAELRIHPLGAAVVSWKDPEPLGTVELVENPTPGLFAIWPDKAFRRDRSRPGLVYTATAAGLRMDKEFIPGSGTVLPRLRVTVSNVGASSADAGTWTLSLGPGLGTIATEQKENQKLWRALALREGENGLEGKVETFKPGQAAGPFRWIGVDNRYFLAALAPAAGDFASTAVSLPPQVTLTASSAVLPPGRARVWEVPFYVGPKGHTWLSQYHQGLERSINFGFFAQIGRVILRALNVLHRRTGNWGWSIILLTTLLQILLFPLTYKSLKANYAMRRLQPEIARLQQRYAKDPAKLQSEMMELYKKNGANPLGGCLPMLLQMPVFFALYNALRNAWELHGASWILWIKDLSAKDPYYVLPLTMGGLMFLQSRLNPQAGGDPAQAQMMTWMPVIFTFMFLNFPSGLVLYWLTNSLLSTLQQLALRNRFNQGARTA